MNETVDIDPERRLERVNAIEAMLRSFGIKVEDSAHTRETPERVEKSLRFLLSGYEIDPAWILSTRFIDPQYDEMILVKEIPFYSMCAHHMLPFFGKAAVAYVPGLRKDPVSKEAIGYEITGLSKLARLVECYARRLQIQEQMTRQIASALDTELDPKGVAVVIEAEHLCMSCRGIQKVGANTVTSVMWGCFREEPEARTELLLHLRGCNDSIPL